MVYVFVFFIQTFEVGSLVNVRKTLKPNCVPILTANQEVIVKLQAKYT